MIILTIMLIVILICNLILEIASYRLKISEKALRNKECRSQMYLANELKKFNNLVEQTRKERYGTWD